MAGGDAPPKTAARDVDVGLRRGGGALLLKVVGVVGIYVFMCELMWFIGCFEVYP
jgi:hypothetical protein